QAAYNSEAAARFGAVVWDSAERQSRILYLDLAAKMLAQDGNAPIILRRDVASLLRAELYLIGACSPNTDELARIDRAFWRAQEIFGNTGKFIAAMGGDVTVEVPQRATVDTVLAGQWTGADVPTVDVSLAECKERLIDYLAYAEGRSADITAAYAREKG